MKSLFYKTLFYTTIILQQLSIGVKAQSDCNNPILLTDTSYHIQQVTGYGNTKEFHTHTLKNKYYFPNETKSVWYKTIAKQNGTLTFDIIPDNPHDDWDFLVFKLNKDTTCQHITTEKIKPLRTNISRNNLTIHGKTGLNQTSNYLYVTSGINPEYSKQLNVHQNDTILIVVNNFKNTNNGHTIKLHWKYHQTKKITTKDTIQKTKQETNTKNNTIPLTIQFTDADNNNPVNVSGTISGLKTQPIEIKNTSKIQQEIPKKTTYFEITVSAPNYIINYEKLRIKKTQTKAEYTIKLHKLAKKQKAYLPNILFQPASPKFLPTSYQSLKVLEQFMQQNPTIKITIQGHVNGPDMPNTKEYKTLSTQRAQAVYNYLKEKGIDPARMKYIGKGNTQMLYPDPKNEHQSSLNRRVEIIIEEI